MAISRRGLLVSGLAVGGGLTVLAVNRRLDDGDAGEKFAASTPGAVALNAWLKITPDGRAICGVHRAEMGQGVTTALPMMLAEELDLDWSRVSFEFTPVDRDYFNFAVLLRGQPLGDTVNRPMAAVGERLLRRAFHAVGISMTISSTSVVDAWDSLRIAGAAARAMLIDAAAARWGVPASRLETEAGRVVDPRTGESLDYGELAGAAARMAPPDKPVPKDPARFRLIGQSPPRLDVPAKVRGQTRFGIDVVLPNMLFAAVRHSPVLGTRVDAVDNAAEVSAMAGVEGVVRVSDGAVAVVARDSWAAMKAAARLSLKPEIVDVPAIDSAAARESARAALDDPRAAVFRSDGDAHATLAGDRGSLEALYELPCLAHVCMEPMNCTALLTAAGLTVWAPTQAESIARDVAAQVADVAAHRVTVHRTFMGGGFGRRVEMDFVAQAVAAARVFPGRPVKLMFSREQDIRHDMYRPAAVARVRAGIDAAGRMHAWDYVIATQSVTASYYLRTPTPRGGDARRDEGVASGASNLIYSIPHLRVAFVPQDPRVPAGFWRSVGYSHNCFVVESFIDELAHAARVDPVEFRLRHLEASPKHRAVLQEAVRLSAWTESAGPDRGRGVALIECHDSIVATVVEVSVSRPGGLRVERILCVLDCRQVIHPDIAVQQIQGGILDGLGAALYGEITVRGAAVEQANFNDYRMLRLADTPAIEVHLLPQGGRPGGVGEPGVPGVAPALANAIFAATGRRIRRLPIVPAQA